MENNITVSLRDWEEKVRDQRSLEILSGLLGLDGYLSAAQVRVICGLQVDKIPDVQPTEPAIWIEGMEEPEDLPEEPGKKHYMNQSIEPFKVRLKKAMDLQALKPVELAEKCGISKSTVSHYMSGYTKPKSNRLYIMAKILNVNEAWLMGFDVPPEAPDPHIGIPDSIPNSEAPIEGKKKGRVVDRGKVLALHKAGWSNAKIADEMGCHPSRISQILKEER